MARTANSTEELIAIMNEQVQKLVPLTVAMMPEYIEGVVKPEVKMRCPSEAEEAWLISMDTQGVGTPEGGRFLRDGSESQGMSAVQAVELEKPQVIGNMVTFGNIQNLNRRTVFSWYNRKFEEIRTAATWIYMEILEWGGTWTVRPQAGTKALHPEDGVFRSQMSKSIDPHLMFTQGAHGTRSVEQLLTKIREVVTNVLSN
ncbi:MAG: hypothetical protein WC775_06405 [Patescibacteria group bacterium]|jgi:hypothetical protein